MNPYIKYYHIIWLFSTRFLYNIVNNGMGGRAEDIHCESSVQRVKYNQAGTPYRYPGFLIIQQYTITRRYKGIAYKEVWIRMHVLIQGCCFNDVLATVWLTSQNISRSSQPPETTFLSLHLSAREMVSGTGPLGFPSFPE